MTRQARSGVASLYLDERNATLKAVFLTINRDLLAAKLWQEPASVPCARGAETRTGGTLALQAIEPFPISARFGKAVNSGGDEPTHHLVVHRRWNTFMRYPWRELGGPRRYIPVFRCILASHPSDPWTVCHIGGSAGA